MSEKSVFDKAIRSVDDIGANVKFDDAVRIADKAFEIKGFKNGTNK